MVRLRIRGKEIIVKNGVVDAPDEELAEIVRNMIRFLMGGYEPRMGDWNEVFAKQLRGTKFVLEVSPSA